MNRAALIDYIVRNNHDYKVEHLIKESLEFLVILKVQTELEVEKKKQLLRGVSLRDQKKDDSKNRLRQG